MSGRAINTNGENLIFFIRISRLVAIKNNIKKSSRRCSDVADTKKSDTNIVGYQRVGSASLKFQIGAFGYPKSQESRLRKLAGRSCLRSSCYFKNVRFNST